MIGSHNSMSYLPVRQWYLKPFGWMARCQSENIVDQFFKYNVRLFDLRVRFTNGELVFAHGPIEFQACVCDALELLNGMSDPYEHPTYVRIILESNKPMKDQDLQEEDFKLFCDDIQRMYPNITFFGGNRKYDWKEIYHFNTTVDLIDDYSSTTNIFGGSKDHWTAKLDDLWPWLYAKLRNKKNIRNYKDEDGILFIDYVNIR